jgi:hypothetical protein
MALLCRSRAALTPPSDGKRIDVKRMNIAATAGVLAATALSLAAPASADLVDGTYRMVRPYGNENG